MINLPLSASTTSSLNIGKKLILLTKSTGIPEIVNERTLHLE